jgi:hypothetical protein
MGSVGCVLGNCRTTDSQSEKKQGKVIQTQGWLWQKANDLYDIEIFFNKQLAYVVKYNIHDELNLARLREVLYDYASAEHCRLCGEIIRRIRHDRDGNSA